MAKPQNTSVIVARRRDSIALPPGTMGYAHLTEPEEYDDKKAFKLDVHYNPAGIAALQKIIQTECIDANLEKLREEMQGNNTLKGLSGKDAQGPSDWLEGKLKTPKENFKVQLPKITLSCKAERKGRDGKVFQVSIGCWDAKNQPLDLGRMKLGIGSIICPIVNANLFISKLIGFPQPSLNLVGVRVLQRVSWGGQRPPQETDDEAIREVMGEAFQFDEDLSSFAAGSDLPGEEPQPPSADDVVGGAF